MNLNGNIRISRPTGGEEHMRVDIIDEKSGVMFATARIDLGDFSKALTSQQVPCQVTVRGPDRLGREREIKGEWIDIEGVEPDRYLDVLKECEVDGWVAHAEDIINPRRRLQRGGRLHARVDFTRWV